ncbi:hypothetical protein DBR24_04435 [Pseudomonas sp. HMWF006]|nr:hypothetical protein DBR24_04435 [Pseudomonas sp. HMWF006]PTT70067.1 hypothetical protein DBR26_10375 [Pseudomonas sp. HMWF007]PTT95321.1 hypothetical protein DBR29_00600 [Pseudomonas sp. HMWF005]
MIGRARLLSVESDLVAGELAPARVRSARFFGSAAQPGASKRPRHRGCGVLEYRESAQTLVPSDNVFQLYKHS